MNKALRRPAMLGILFFMVIGICLYATINQEESPLDYFEGLRYADFGEDGRTDTDEIKKYGFVFTSVPNSKFGEAPYIIGWPEDTGFDSEYFGTEKFLCLLKKAEKTKAIYGAVIYEYLARKNLEGWPSTEMIDEMMDGEIWQAIEVFNTPDTGR